MRKFYFSSCSHNWIINLKNCHKDGMTIRVLAAPFFPKPPWISTNSHCHISLMQTLKHIVRPAKKYKGTSESYAWISQSLTFGIGFNGAETNRRIAHILGILLMNSCNTDIHIFFLATKIISSLSALNWYNKHGMTLPGGYYEERRACGHSNCCVTRILALGVPKTPKRKFSIVQKLTAHGE